MYIESGGTPPPPDTMFVFSIDVTRFLDKGNKYRGQADVVAYDHNNQPLVGAVVMGHFSGPSSDSQSGTTGSDGRTTILSEKTRNPVGIWCFTVDNIILGSNIYDQSRNNESSDCEGSGRIAAGLPMPYELSQNYPNPFNAVTEIKVTLLQSSEVSLDIYNVIGQKISTLVEGNLEAGTHAFRWDASDNPSGVYFYSLKYGGNLDIRKMILLK
jgi:hypothetical protein